MTDPPITEKRAEELLMYELSDKADRINDFLIKSSVLLSDQQYSALVSFAYNCGCGPIVDSGKSMHEAVKSDNILKIADCFLIYNKATKRFGPFKRTVTLPGLTRRRKAERHLFLNGFNRFYF
jgi:GH24 family phage-related lysozyme (muramidase)